MLAAYANSGIPCTIHLADGTYSPSTNGEYFPIGGKNYVYFSGESQDSTILNGDSLTSIFYFEDNGDITISDLTVTNGYTFSKGGGIAVENTDIIINNVTVSNNVVEQSGV